jgi:NAD(P)-dependent dehydrogenase (short-subunit alcohol dehydrogenase family)
MLRSNVSMNVVVTGGGTIAPIDDVRILTNVSSGRFAAAIAEAFLDRGARVWHVHAPSAQRPLWRHAAFALDTANPAAELDRLASVREKWLSQRGRLTLVPLEIGNVDDYASTLRQVLQSHPIDVVCLPMAVADFEPEPRPGKISSEAESLVISCRRTPKVIRQVRDWAPAVYLVGFKLLSRAGRDQLLGAADIAGRANRADLTVANDLETLRAGRHTIHLVRPGCDPETLGPGPDLADRLVARVMTWSSLRSPHAGPTLSSSHPE